MLEFNLSGINTIAMKVSRTYIDLINPDAKLNKNSYIECLSHDCYFIQVSRINAETYNDMDKCSELLQMLSVFEQDYFVDDEKTIKKYPYTITKKKKKKMIDTLEYIAADPIMRKIMKEEYWAAMNERIWKSQVETLSEESAAKADKIAELSSENTELRRQLQQAGISISTNLN
jgi:roadblock/LC7 domain-containing protein